MITFLSILFVLIAINAALLIFSVNGTNKKSKSTAATPTGSPSRIFPLDLINSKYKKAV